MFIFAKKFSYNHEENFSWLGGNFFIVEKKFFIGCPRMVRVFINFFFIFAEKKIL